MKRFWKLAEHRQSEQGWTIELDGKPVRTPARALLELPTEPLAAAIAAEWAGASEKLDPPAMPLTGFAYAAIDQIALDPSAFAGTLAKYAETDLLCYRAEEPRELVERQAAAWDPLLGWARRRFDVDFSVTPGVLHVAQPQATVERLAHEVHKLGAFQLAGLAPQVTIGGSLVVALAMLDDALGAEAAWDAVSLDERWQIEHWGADAEAGHALANRRRDFLAAAHFLELLES